MGSDFIGCAHGELTDCAWVASYVVLPPALRLGARAVLALRVAIDAGVGIGRALEVLRAGEVSAEALAKLTEEVNSLTRLVDCPGNSFVAGTRVLLADGTTEPIEAVAVGDLVLAGDPATGRTGGEPVTACPGLPRSHNLIKPTDASGEPTPTPPSAVSATGSPVGACGPRGGGVGSGGAAVAPASGVPAPALGVDRVRVGRDMSALRRVPVVAVRRVSSDWTTGVGGGPGIREPVWWPRWRGSWCQGKCGMSGMTGRIFADPGFGVLLRQLREERRLSLRRLGQRVHCSHGYLWDLESGKKNPSVALASQLDEALNAGGRLSALVRDDSTGDRSLSQLPSGFEFVSDWRRGIDVATAVWAGDLQRGRSNRDPRFEAAAFIPPAMRWLLSPGDERPSGSGERLVGTPEVETVRQITTVYRGLDNQYGGGHVRESLVRFLHNEVAEMLRGRYDARTGAALLSTASEATQQTAWATYDVGMNGLAQQYMIQALRLSAAAGDRALGAEILAAMSHQSAHVGASAEAVDLARAAGQAAAEVGVAAIQAESAVLEAQGHAVGGDEAACAVALDRAEHTLDRADRTSDPQWIGYFDEAYLAAKFGHCFAALGRGDLARRFAARSLDMDGRRYARGRQFNLALLAVAHAQAGEIEQASQFGVQAADAAEGLHSRRARDYLADIADRLAPHAGVAAVRVFMDRVGDTIPRRG